MQSIGISGDQERFVAGFEKLWVWQKAYKLMLEMHQLSKKIGSFVKKLKWLG